MLHDYSWLNNKTQEIVMTCKLCIKHNVSTDKNINFKTTLNYQIDSTDNKQCRSR